MIPGISNAGFEQGLTGWSTTGTSGGTVQLVNNSANAHSGNYYVDLSAPSGGYASVVGSDVPVNPGDQITFGGWVYLESGGSSWQPGWWLGVRDANHVALNIWASASPAPGSGWTYQSGTYTVPASGVAYVRLFANVYQNTATTSFRIDDGFLIGGAQYYIEDLLGSSRIVTTSSGVVCYDADFYPYGGERVPYTDTCTQNNYKFESKERDAETGNDDFGARYYSNRFGRWLSADWSNVIVAIPYADLTNPQTFNLYSMVTNDPESFADLDGHCKEDGGSHGFWWCVGHALGINESQEEYTARVETERKWLINNVSQNSDQTNVLKNFTSAQVDNLYWKWSTALLNALCGGFSTCDEVPQAKDFTRTASGSFVLYRGGGFENVTDYKVDANGNVRAIGDPAARGPSLNSDPSQLPPRFSGNTNEVKLLLPELTTRPWGKAGHFEIVPREPMTPSRFLQLLREIILEPFKEPIE